MSVWVKIPQSRYISLWRTSVQSQSGSGLKGSQVQKCSCGICIIVNLFITVIQGGLYDTFLRTNPSDIQDREWKTERGKYVCGYPVQWLLVESCDSCCLPPTLCRDDGNIANIVRVTVFWSWCSVLKIQTGVTFQLCGAQAPVVKPKVVCVHFSRIKHSPTSGIAIPRHGRESLLHNSAYYISRSHTADHQI